MRNRSNTVDPINFYSYRQRRSRRDDKYFRTVQRYRCSDAETAYDRDGNEKTKAVQMRATKNRNLNETRAALLGGRCSGMLRNSCRYLRRRNEETFGCWRIGSRQGAGQSMFSIFCLLDGSITNRHRRSVGSLRYERVTGFRRVNDGRDRDRIVGYGGNRARRDGFGENKLTFHDSLPTVRKELASTVIIIGPFR